MNEEESSDSDDFNDVTFGVDTSDGIRDVNVSIPVGTLKLGNIVNEVGTIDGNCEENIFDNVVGNTLVPVRALCKLEVVEGADWGFVESFERINVESSAVTMLSE